MTSPDSILELADERGLLSARVQLADDLDGFEPSDLAAHVLGLLPAADEEVVVVTDELDCHSVGASELACFIARAPGITGGDTIFVGTESPRVVVLHHAGWVFGIG